jgi:CRP-like cAMP-binding protein
MTNSILPPNGPNGPLHPIHPDTVVPDILRTNHEAAFLPEPQSENERIAQTACVEVLTAIPGYQGTFSFGTPGGNDLDLRLCFADIDQVAQQDIRHQLIDRLRSDGVAVDLDIFFMTGQEFRDGIRDLVELGSIEQHLEDGFDSHQDPLAVGDMSMFSLYIFSTMRALHLNPAAGAFGSPQEGLERLTLNPDGAVGWMHYYTGCFLHDYLNQDPTKYLDRLAKFSSRVVIGSTLAQLDLQQLANIKPQLVNAIRSANATTSTDATMAEVLLANPDTVALLSNDSQELLRAAGRIRSGNREAIPPNFIQLAEVELFYAAFQQGIHRRMATGEDMDPLTAFALSELIRQLGTLEVYEPGEHETLIRQGDQSHDLFYIPLKTTDKTKNGAVDITVRGPDGKETATYTRRAGILGEGALFGLPRSATVRATERTEAYKIEAQIIRDLLANPDVFQQLQHPLLNSLDARRTDILLRYLAIQAGIFTRQTLPYTSLAAREVAQQNLGTNPLDQYNLGMRFHDTLQLFAQPPQAGESNVVTTIATTGQTQTLFQTNQTIDRLYVVSEGTVQIPLQNGETITLQAGELFGESSILGLPTTGTAILTQNSRVLSVDALWFKRFTQSRQHIQGTNILPVHLLYHLAAEGYDRVRRRLTTQN